MTMNHKDMTPNTTQSRKATRPRGLARSLKATLPLLVAAGILGSGCASTQRLAHPTTQAEQAAISPAEALRRLEDGNARFVAGRPVHRDWGQQRAATAAAQYPFAVVLSCIDSRASSELVFDQGVGDIFNARVAGNVLNDDLLGSMEFACKVAGAKLIAVVAHTSCGAVKGACAGVEMGHLTGLLDRIQPSVAQAKAQQPGGGASDPKFVDTVAMLNVKAVKAQIRDQSPILRELIDAGKVGLVGGVHHLETGRVEFFGL